MFVILEIARITETMRQPSEKSESKGSGLLKKHNTNFKHSNLREGETGAEAQMEAEYVIHVISTFSTVTEAVSMTILNRYHFFVCNGTFPKAKLRQLRGDILRPRLVDPFLYKQVLSTCSHRLVIGLGRR